MRAAGAMPSRSKNSRARRRRRRRHARRRGPPAATPVQSPARRRADRRHPRPSLPPAPGPSRPRAAPSSACRRLSRPCRGCRETPVPSGVGLALVQFEAHIAAEQRLALVGDAGADRASHRIDAADRRDARARCRSGRSGSRTARRAFRAARSAGQVSAVWENGIAASRRHGDERGTPLRSGPTASRPGARSARRALDHASPAPASCRAPSPWKTTGRRSAGRLPGRDCRSVRRRSGCADQAPAPGRSRRAAVRRRKARRDSA